MEGMTYVLDDRVWTRAERDGLPDDGARYELVDGTLVVTPSPVRLHQRVVARLFRILIDACPAHLEVLTAPMDVVLAPDTVVQPDLLVASLDGDDGQPVTGAPLLAVEVLSPSTQVIDRNLKLHRYERAGTPSYWLVDPVGPRVTAYELSEGRYRVVADVQRDQVWTAERPYPMTIRPRDLA